MPHSQFRSAFLVFAVLGWMLLAHAVLTVLGMEPAWAVAPQAIVGVTLIAAGLLAGIGHGDED